MRFFIRNLFPLYFTNTGHYTLVLMDGLLHWNLTCFPESFGISFWHQVGKRRLDPWKILCGWSQVSSEGADLASLVTHMNQGVCLI